MEHRHYVHSAPAGFVYLAAILDWYSRKVLAWRLSNTLETRFCLDCLDEALRRGQPSIFNSDQGAQFTSTGFTGRLTQAGIRISMDGRGRAHDNIFVERLWRSVKYEEVYPNGYDTLDDAYHGLHRYFEFYNHQRPHQATGLPNPSRGVCRQGSNSVTKKRRGTTLNSIQRCLDNGVHFTGPRLPRRRLPPLRNIGPPRRGRQHRLRQARKEHERLTLGHAVQLKRRNGGHRFIPITDNQAAALRVLTPLKLGNNAICGPIRSDIHLAVRLSPGVKRHAAQPSASRIASTWRTTPASTSTFSFVWPTAGWCCCTA